MNTPPDAPIIALCMPLHLLNQPPHHATHCVICDTPADLGQDTTQKLETEQLLQHAKPVCVLCVQHLHRFVNTIRQYNPN